jgi:hypothetical protein
VPCLVMQMGAAGLRPQAQNRASGAWLRVRRRKRLSGEMGGGGRVVCRREWQCGGAVFGRASGLAGLGLKTETGPLVLGYGCAIGNGCREQWGEVVGWCAPGSGGVVVPCLVTQAGTAGLGPKDRNQAAGAQFPPCRWNLQRRAMEEVVVGCMRGIGIGGGGVVRWTTQGGGAGLDPNVQN